MSTTITIPTSTTLSSQADHDASPLSPDDLRQFRQQFAESPQNRIVQNAVTSVGVDEIALDRLVVLKPRTAVRPDGARIAPLHRGWC